ncbi:MAG: metallophosphoesterase [Dehalococcoidia bacterium]|nr:metallophosphoesterase [Dehalococcoidia bacterium]
MKIGLISDTHVPNTMPEPPSQVATAFQGVDMILHAGDIYSASCLDWLERIAPVQAVEMDPGVYWENDSRVVARRVLELEGYVIGMAHDLNLRGMGGEAFPGAIPAKFSSDGSLAAALQQFFGRKVDIVVFGHTHYPLVENHQGVLLVNPGSTSLPRLLRKLGTVALLDLTPQGASARVVDLSNMG